MSTNGMQASRRTRPPNKVANRLVTWATGSGHASSAAEPLTLLAAGKEHGVNANKHGDCAAGGNTSAAATHRQGEALGGAAAGAAAADTSEADFAKGDATGTRRASAPTEQAAKPAPVSTGGRWRGRSLKARPEGGSPTAATPAASTPAGLQHMGM